MSGFNTRAIHAGQDADPATGAVIPPLHLTTTYKQDGVGGLRGGYEYSRSANPTRTALEGNLAALEEGERGFAFASGLAAEDTLIRAALAPGGVLVVLELDGLPRFLTAPGFEDRAHAAAAAAGWNHYPEWQSVLEAAGFSVTRTSLTTTAPDGPTARRYARLWFDRFSAGFGMSLQGDPVEFAPRVTRTVWVAEVAR